MYSGGGPDDPPNWNTLGIADVMGATCLAYGVLAAIAGRELNGGKGQRIEVSHIMATMWLQFWGISVGMMQGLESLAPVRPLQGRKSALEPLPLRR